MKKLIILAIILFLMAVQAGCLSSYSIDTEKEEEGQRNTMQENMNKYENEVDVGYSIYTIREKYKDNILLDQYSCVVWKDQEGYDIACIGKNGQTIQAIVKFSEDLELLEANGIEPIEEINQEEWIGKSEQEFVSLYGSCHFDFGSGLYIPSYVSKSGLIYFLYVDDGIIYYISTFSPEKGQRSIILD